MNQLEVDGKFFRANGRRVFLKAVTYGPFPDPQPDHVVEMARIAEAGFNAVRIYGTPDSGMLDAAADTGLWVLVGLSWQWGEDFVRKTHLYSGAAVELVQGLKDWGSHPAVAVVIVANEIPSDMVRWMGVVKVRQAIESLIERGREICPDLLFAYSNFPTTEYLEPDNADFTAMNVYLERREDFQHYLSRLHHVAGDRPVLISEFGLDSRSGSELSQRDVLGWQVESCLQSGMAGTTVYAWSDRWLNRGRVMHEWAFGLTDDQGREKPALSLLSRMLPLIHAPEDGFKLDRWPMFSVVVCTHNGGLRMHACLTAIQELDYPNFEVIVVDDGSTDDTVEVVAAFDGVRLISLEHAGLSAARNRGAEEARGEIVAYTDDDCEPDAAWLFWLAYAFDQGGWDACGGPNLPPIPQAADQWEYVDEAVVSSAPGAPTHVLLSDLEAEHLPGCNLVVRRDVLQAIGGFDVNYRVAGDDVDLCWRLRNAGYKMGFCGAAFVWHRRRTTLWRYFKQQYGYGKAEALLMRDHPDKFRRGSGARWEGLVYGGGAMCVESGSVIYHGAMGMAAYQQLSLTVQPQRPLARGFQGSSASVKLALARKMQPLIRAFSRWVYSLRWRGRVERSPRTEVEQSMRPAGCFDAVEARWSGGMEIFRGEVLTALLAAGWEEWSEDGRTLASDEWDLVRNGMRLLVACEVHDDTTVVLTRMELDSPNYGNLPADFERLMEGLDLCRL